MNGQQASSRDDMGAGSHSELVLAHREAIIELVARYNATAPRVYGSVVRGDDRVGSDIDFLVDFTDEASLLDEAGLRLALSDLLHVGVDVVGSDSLRQPFRDRVLRDARPV